MLAVEEALERPDIDIVSDGISQWAQDASYQTLHKIIAELQMQGMLIINLYLTTTLSDEREISNADNVYAILEEDVDETINEGLSEERDSESVSTTTPEYFSDSDNDDMESLVETRLNQQLPVVEIRVCPSTPISKVQEAEIWPTEESEFCYEVFEDINRESPNSSTDTVIEYKNDMVETWPIKGAYYEVRQLNSDQIDLSDMAESVFEKSESVIEEVIEIETQRILDSIFGDDGHIIDSSFRDVESPIEEHIQEGESSITSSGDSITEVESPVEENQPFFEDNNVHKHHIQNMVLETDSTSDFPSSFEVKNYIRVKSRIYRTSSSSAETLDETTTPPEKLCTISKSQQNDSEMANLPITERVKKLSTEFDLSVYGVPVDIDTLRSFSTESEDSGPKVDDIAIQLPRDEQETVGLIKKLTFNLSVLVQLFFSNSIE